MKIIKDNSQKDKTLSDCLYNLDEEEGILVPNKKGNLLWIGDVKEAVKRLKDEVWNNLQENRKTWDNTGNPEIAQQRMAIANFHQMIIDEIDTIFGEELTKEKK